MGKIVKFCSSCEEGFAEKFTFCPDCGGALQACELNPLVSDAPPIEEMAAAPAAEETNFLEIPEEIVQEAAPAVGFEPVYEPVIESAPPAPEIDTVEEPVIEAAPSLIEVEPVEEPVFAAPAPKAVAASSSIFFQSKPLDADRKPASFEAEHDAFIREGQFYVTVMEEKNVKQRNTLLLGSTALIVALAVGLTIWSLFKIPLTVYAIGDDNMLASMIDNVPMVVDEEKQRKDKDAGGGGGGGRDEEEETTQGDLADQSKNPTRPPDAKVYRSDNFELKTPPPQTEGNRTFDKNFDRWGDPNGRFASFSNGTGSGGGQGSGTGTGQGSGRGTGTGSGDGSGSGSGLGSGNGSGMGDGDGGNPPPTPVGVTQPWKLISKPRASYTDAARQANIQGTVVLKVVFLASGQVGSISAIRGLPNGLTEQAIAAARNIRFEPAKINGVPRAVSKTVEYTFTIY